MKFSLKFPFIVMTWLACFAGAIAYGRLWAFDLVMIGAYVAIAASLASPFLCSESSRGFWSVYAATAGVFLMLALVENEYLTRVCGRITYFAVERAVALTGGSPFVNTGPVQTGLVVTSAPIMGLISGAIWQSIASRKPAEKS